VQCPYCGGDSQVLDSRGGADGVRRRRICNECRRRFTTDEKVRPPQLKVSKRGRGTEAFDTDKLVRCLRRVCRGRPGIGAGDIDRIARAIEARLVDSGARSVRSAQIVELALARLHEVDSVAHDRLAANYLDEDGRLNIEGRSAADDDASQLGLFGGGGGGGDDE
jgi:transcriptional repressor NrdR